MQRRLPDLDSVTGVFDDVAPEIDERQVREQVKDMTADLDLDYGTREPATFGGTDGRPVTVGRAEHVRLAVLQRQYSRVDVPVTGSPGGGRRVTIEQIGPMRMITATSAYDIATLITNRNPQLRVGVSPETTDVTTRVFAEPGRR